MIAAELRRQYRAARTLYRVDQMADRVAAARATLDPLAGPEPVTVPGHRLWRTPDGTIHVAPVPPIDAAQLALWRTITDTSERSER